MIDRSNKVVIIVSLSDERSDDLPFSGKWLAGSTFVTSLEGVNVTLLCIFSGRLIRVFLARDDSLLAERAICYRPSVCLSVYLRKCTFQRCIDYADIAGRFSDKGSTIRIQWGG